MNNKFKNGDKVKMLYQGQWVKGEVTVCKETETKVIWDDADNGLDYWYYPNDDLELDNDSPRKA